MTSNSALNVGFGVSGNVLTSNGPGLAPSFQASSGGASLGYATGYYYGINLIGHSASAGITYPADNIRCVPFQITKNNTFDAFSLNVTVASSAGTSCRLGIYNSVNGLPGTVLVTLGTALTDALGVATVSVSQALTPGYYWFALHNEASSSITSISTGTRSPFMPIGTSWNATNGFTANYSSQPYASGLPNLTGVTPGSLSQAAPIIQMRST